MRLMHMGLKRDAVVLETVFDSEGFCSMGTMACYQRYERAFTGYV